MTFADRTILLYLFFLIVRIRGCVRRWRQPLLRGEEWFFNVHVLPGFYTGPGKKILDRYRLRMFIPFLVDIPFATAIFISGQYLWLSALILALSALIHINHLFSVALAERQAREFAVPEDEQPVPAVVFSVKPRRLRDYANPVIEWTMAIASVASIAWLLRYYFASPEHHNLRLVFWVPAFYLYAHLGLLFVKRIVVEWRTPAPQAQAAEYLDFREQTRRYYLKVCDWCRASVSAGLLFWPVVLNSSPAGINRLMTMWFSATLAVSIVGGVWMEVRRKQLVDVSLRTRPVRLPDFVGESGIAKWPVCYQPSMPMMVLKSARGYSLNMANTLSYLGTAYLAGMAGLILLLVVRR